MSKRQLKLIELLETIKNKLTGDSDIVWTRYNSVAEMKKDLDRLIDGVRTNDEKTYHDLQLLFGPTGSFQELSISNGWGEEFLRLAKNFDDLI